MIAVANSGSINLKKTGTIRTRGVLSKKGEKKGLDFFLVLLPIAQVDQNCRYVDGITVMVKLQYTENRFEI